MIFLVLVLILVLWLMGFLSLSFLNIILFHLAGRPITLYNLLILLIILWVVGILPSPLRQIVMILFLLWLLSIIGIITIGGFSQLVVVAIIIGVIISLF